METKIPEWFLSFHEYLFSTQLRAIRQLKAPEKPSRSLDRENLCLILIWL
jgi:hypothetical protein